MTGTVTCWSLSLQNWQQWLVGLWVYITVKSNLLVFGFTELATEVCQSLGLHNWQKQPSSLLVYQTGNRGLPVFGFTKQETPTCRSLDLQQQLIQLFVFEFTNLSNWSMNLQKWLKQFLVFKATELSKATYWSLSLQNWWLSSVRSSMHSVLRRSHSSSSISVNTQCCHQHIYTPTHDHINYH